MEFPNTKLVFSGIAAFMVCAVAAAYNNLQVTWVLRVISVVLILSGLFGGRVADRLRAKKTPKSS